LTAPKKKEIDEIMQVLEEVSSAVKVLQLDNEKMEWIDCGLLPVLLKYRGTICGRDYIYI